MNADRELDDILSEIGREHRAIGAPESLEPLLFAASASRIRDTRQRRMRLTWALATAAILLAVVAAGGIVWQTRGSHPRQTQQAQLMPARPVGPESRPAPVQDPGRQKSVPKSAPLHKTGPAHVNLRDSSAKQPAWNSLDEFVALPVSEGLPAATELSVVRVRVRGSELRQYGLEAPPDAGAQTLLAEFAVGEDGLPRAIRIVR